MKVKDIEILEMEYIQEKIGDQKIIDIHEVYQWKKEFAEKTLIEIQNMWNERIMKNKNCFECGNSIEKADCFFFEGQSYCRDCFEEIIENLEETTK